MRPYTAVKVLKDKNEALNVIDNLQSILGWFSDIKWKIDFFWPQKSIFENFWGHFWLILDVKAEKILKLGYFAGLNIDFWDLKSKIRS